MILISPCRDCLWIGMQAAISMFADSYGLDGRTTEKLLAVI
jgi:hypothetical protein